MSVDITIENYRANPFAHPQFPGSVDALASTTRTLKQVNADDYNKNYDALAAFGVAVKEDTSYRPGVEEITAAGTVAATTHVALVDTDGVGFTVTLQPVATVGDGFTLYVSMRTDGGGDLTVDGDGAETVLGSATQVLTDAGDVLRLQADTTAGGWVAV